jgi:threonine dehydrogenase-like Zn-dependent dehydrogenase
MDAGKGCYARALTGSIIPHKGERFARTQFKGDALGRPRDRDNTCPHCRAGYQSSCIHREFITRARAPLLRVPLADGTLVPTPGMPSDDLIPSLLTISDVFGTGWFAADAANVKPGMTVVVVGDGAVGLLALLSAKQMGAGRIIAMSRHEARQKLAREVRRHRHRDRARRRRHCAHQGADRRNRC